jgi:hypothetical protein
MHYVYVWYKPDGTPFYVGIGKTAIRWNPQRSWRSRNAFCKAVLRKYGTDNILYSVFGVPSTYTAQRYERVLIARIGRADVSKGPLTNLTDGGEGTEALGESAKAVLRAKWAADTYRKEKLSTQSRSEVNIARAKKRAQDPLDLFAKAGSEQCRKINASPELTKKRKEALALASEKISAGVLASMEKRLVTMRTPEVQAKLRRPKTAEHNQKVSDAKKLWWAARKAAAAHGLPHAVIARAS